MTFITEIKYFNVYLIHLIYLIFIHIYLDIYSFLFYLITKFFFVQFFNKKKLLLIIIIYIEDVLTSNKFT